MHLVLWSGVMMKKKKKMKTKYVLSFVEWCYDEKNKKNKKSWEAYK